MGEVDSFVIFRQPVWPAICVSHNEMTYLSFVVQLINKYKIIEVSGDYWKK